MTEVDMKLPKGTWVFLIVLILNNVTLLYLLGYFSADSVPKTGSPSSAEIAQIEGIAGSKISSVPDPGAADQARADSSKLMGPLNEEKLLDALQRVAKTEDFVWILDEYQLSASRRFEEANKRLQKLSATELYELALDSKGKWEKYAAMQLLVQGKFNKLDEYALKELYRGADTQEWNRVKIVEELLERGDPDGLVWARKMLADSQSQIYTAPQLIEAVYDNDPEFIHAYVDNIEIEDIERGFGVMNFALRKQDIAEKFLTKNFDRIVNSENAAVLNLFSSSVSFKMTESQQSQIVGMLHSRNKHKRHFAISLIRNIDSIDTLRSSYEVLEKQSEKSSFIYALHHKRNSKEKRALALEFAAESSDPTLADLGSIRR